MHPWDFVTNDPRDHILELWKELRRDHPLVIDGSFRRKDGSSVPADVRLVRFESEGRDLLIATCRDVSDRKRTEADLRARIKEREHAQEVMRGQTQALAKTLRTLSIDPSLETFLSDLLRVVTEQFDAFCAALWFFDGRREWLVPEQLYENGKIYTSRDEPEHTANRRMLVRHLPDWQEFADTKRPLTWSDCAGAPSVPPELRDYLSAQGVRSGLAVPLTLGEELIGVLTIRSTEANRFTDEDLQLAQALAHQATLAVQLTRLGDRAREAAVLAERNRLAREIHDTLAQSFAGLTLQVEAAEASLAAGAGDALAHLGRAKALAKFGLSEARRSVLALRPVALEEAGLEKALQQLAERSSVEGAISCEFSGIGRAQRLPSNVELGVFRIAQEAVSNAVRHARASRIAVALSFSANSIEVAIEDNGVGVADEQAALASGGYGLPTMRERSEAIRGTFDFQSSLGRGTRVIVRVPVFGSVVEPLL
jgi:signal transduction histidine kinase